MAVKTKAVSDKVLIALEKAIDRAEQRAFQFATPGELAPSSKADMAIKKLMKDRILTREELDRPITN